MNNTTCPHCQQNTIREVGSSIDCTNPDCPGFMLTLEPTRFMSLTDADFAAFEAGHDYQVLNQMNIEQAEFEARMEQLEIDLAARAVARKPDERTFG